MFIDNKYTRIYYTIIDRARQRSYTDTIEHHHIIPRSLGGTDEVDNIVRLTPREHYICHALLVRMVEDKRLLYKMMLAFNMMHVDAYGNRYTSKLYEYNKVKYYRMKSEVQKGSKRSEEAKQKQSASTRGKPWSEKRKATKIHKPTAQPIVAHKKDTGELVGEWESMSMCARALECDVSAIWRILTAYVTPTPDGILRPTKTHKGYIFAYK